MEKYNQEKKCNQNQEKKCQHLNIDNQNNLSVCVDCGMEINRNIVFNKEWRYYGASDTRYNSDPNRCQVRKISDRSIFKDVINLGGDALVATFKHNEKAWAKHLGNSTENAIKYADEVKVEGEESLWPQGPRFYPGTPT